jgi:hypothetical protein
MIVSGTVMIQQAITLNGDLTAENPATFNNGLTVTQGGFDLFTCSRNGVVFQFPVILQPSVTIGSDTSITGNLTLSGQIEADSDLSKGQLRL